MTPAGSIGYIWGMNALIFTLVGLRFYTQLTHGCRRFTAADWVTLSVVLTIFIKSFLTTWLLKQQQCGLLLAPNILQKMEPPAEYQLYWKLVFTTSFMTYAEVWGIKAIFLAIYLELANRFTRPLMLLLGALTIFLLSTFVSAVLALVLECRPLPYTWTPLLNPKCCPFYGVRSLSIYLGMSTAGDIALLLFPLILLSTVMRLPSHLVKSVLFVVFIGCISIGAGVARYVALMRMMRRPMDSLAQHNTTQGVVWAYVELVFGIAASCLPVFRVYLRKNKKSTVGSSRDQVQKRMGGGGTARTSLTVLGSDRESDFSLGELELQCDDRASV